MEWVLSVYLDIIMLCLIFQEVSLNLGKLSNQKKKRRQDNKYDYEIDFSSALKAARKFFIRRDSHKSVNIIKLIMKYVHAVKTEFRQLNRPLRGIGAIHFGYR